MNRLVNTHSMTLILMTVLLPCAVFAAQPPDYTRTPVLMVHGYFPVPAADWVTWGTFKNKLIDDGWPEEYVMAPQFNDTMGCDPDHAREISAWVDELRAKTGFDKINIVAHSEGGLNTMYYLRYFCGVHKVANFVGLAVAVHGTTTARLDFWSCGAEEMAIPKGDEGWQGNPVLAGINECDETLGDILYTSIWSEFDEIIVPQEGSKMAGAMNIEMNAVVEHGLIFLNNESFGYMKDAFLNRRGLNTDGPGWDCIQHCVLPDEADSAEMPQVTEQTEQDNGGQTADVTEEIPVTDIITTADVAGDGPIVVPYDPGPKPSDQGTRPDSRADINGAGDTIATIDQGNGTDNGTVTPPTSSGGCSSTETATGLPAVLFITAIVLIALRRRTSSSQRI